MKFYPRILWEAQAVPGYGPFIQAVPVCLHTQEDFKPRPKDMEMDLPWIEALCASRTLDVFRLLSFMFSSYIFSFLLTLECGEID